MNGNSTILATLETECHIVLHTVDHHTYSIDCLSSIETHSCFDICTHNTTTERKSKSKRIAWSVMHRLRTSYRDDTPRGKPCLIHRHLPLKTIEITHNTRWTVCTLPLCCLEKTEQRFCENSRDDVSAVMTLLLSMTNSGTIDNKLPTFIHTITNNNINELTSLYGETIRCDWA